MNKFLKQLRNTKGFTLIELLVVIGILGILAAALIATIDPFEQLKKAQDSNTKNTTVEFVTANIRYYSTHNAIPTNCATSRMIGASDTCVTDLINDGELKVAFTTAASVYTNISFIGGSQSMTACFRPSSKSQQRDPNTKYNSDGTPCAVPGSGTCWWCSL
jgi:prepilin-type N-terminal cleavage/methylation domain-containing protein